MPTARETNGYAPGETSSSSQTRITPITRFSTTNAAVTHIRARFSGGSARRTRGKISRIAIPSSGLRKIRLIAKITAIAKSLTGSCARKALSLSRTIPTIEAPVKISRLNTASQKTAPRSGWKRRWTKKSTIAAPQAAPIAGRVPANSSTITQTKIGSRLSPTLRSYSGMRLCQRSSRSFQRSSRSMLRCLRSSSCNFFSSSISCWRSLASSTDCSRPFCMFSTLRRQARTSSSCRSVHSRSRASGFSAIADA